MRSAHPVIAFVLILFSGCLPPWVHGKETTEGDPLFPYILFCGGGSSESRAQLEDLLDGTIKETVTSTTTNPCSGPVTTQTFYYIKKCVQGQIFRSAQNDCRGAGTLGSNWNAVTLQYCPTNDFACETDFPFGAGSLAYWRANANSPAQASCYSDTTAGRSWRLLPPLYPQYPGTITSDMLPLFPDLPAPPSSIWAGESRRYSYPQEAYTFALVVASQWATPLKNTFNFVQCGSYSP